MYIPSNSEIQSGQMYALSQKEKDLEYQIKCLSKIVEKLEAKILAIETRNKINDMFLHGD